MKKLWNLFETVSIPILAGACAFNAFGLWLATPRSTQASVLFGASAFIFALVSLLRSFKVIEQFAYYAVFGFGTLSLSGAAHLIGDGFLTVFLIGMAGAIFLLSFLVKKYPNAKKEEV